MSPLDMMESSIKTNLSNPSTDFKIKADAKAFKTLSSTLYADKVAAPIREILCNALDAQIAAGTADQAIEIYLPTAIEPTFEIRDFGTGLPLDTAKNLYTTYFYSTKEDDPNAIGKYGLGSKAAFAISQTFQVTSYYNGRKYALLAYVDENYIPQITELENTETTEPNGLHVSIPVVSRLNSEVAEKTAKFIQRFKGAVSIKRGYLPSVNQITTIYRGSFWEYAENLPATTNINIGGVLYPIELEAIQQYSAAPSSNIEISDAQEKSAPRISIDQLRQLSTKLLIEAPINSRIDIAPSREHLSYDPTTQRQVYDLLCSVYDELTSKIETIYATNSEPNTAAIQLIAIGTKLPADARQILSHLITQTFTKRYPFFDRYSKHNGNPFVSIHSNIYRLAAIMSHYILPGSLGSTNIQTHNDALDVVLKEFQNLNPNDPNTPNSNANIQPGSGQQPLPQRPPRVTLPSLNLLNGTQNGITAQPYNGCSGLLQSFAIKTLTKDGQRWKSQAFEEFIEFNPKTTKIYIDDGDKGSHAKIRADYKNLIWNLAKGETAKVIIITPTETPFTIAITAKETHQYLVAATALSKQNPDVHLPAPNFRLHINDKAINCSKSHRPLEILLHDLAHLTIKRSTTLNKVERKSSQRSGTGTNAAEHDSKTSSTHLIKNGNPIYLTRAQITDVMHRGGIYFEKSRDYYENCRIQTTYELCEKFSKHLGVEMPDIVRLPSHKLKKLQFDPKWTSGRTHLHHLILKVPEKIRRDAGLCSDLTKNTLIKHILGISKAANCVRWAAVFHKRSYLRLIALRRKRLLDAGYDNQLIGAINQTISGKQLNRNTDLIVRAQKELLKHYPLLQHFDNNAISCDQAHIRRYVADAAKRANKRNIVKP